jgi:Zn-finger nucleic acid-binding protein
VLEELIRDVQNNVFDRAEMLANAAPQHINPPTIATTAYVKCPDCRTIMNRRQFAHGANVIIDGCKGHGTFFDAGELRKVVDFMKSGGLVKAAKLEQQQRETTQRDLARNRAQLHYASPATLHSDDSVDVTGAEVVAGLILSLFW